MPTAIHRPNRSLAAMPRSVANFTASQPSPLHTSGRHDAGNHQHPSSRILLAFHETSESDLVAALLTRHGYAMDCCKNGREALDRIAVRAFGLVVTEMSMPRMDGLELIRTLHRHRPGLPVIAVAKGPDGMDQIYQRSALLFGAVSTHCLPLNHDLFLATNRQAMQIAPDVEKVNSVVPIDKGEPPCESGCRNAGHSGVPFEGARG